MHVDHVLPVSKGGTDDLANLVAACTECNLGKSDSLVDACPPAASTAKGTRIHPMRGMGFLSFRNGECYEQGVIENVIEDRGVSFALVVYFEWAGGSETYRRMIPISDFALDERQDDSLRSYRLFSDNEDRNNYYEWKSGGFEKGAV